MAPAITYGATIWEEAVKYKEYRNIIKQLQRRNLVLVCKSYRDNSLNNLSTVANIMLIDLKLNEINQRTRLSDMAFKYELGDKVESKTTAWDLPHPSKRI